MLSIRSLLLLLFVATFSSYTQAWGPTGHRVIGKIAEGHLTPNAKQALLPLLGGDKLAEITTWADEMRSSPEEFWQRESPRWHYVSIDTYRHMKELSYSMPYTGKVKDIYSAILKCITVLKDQSSKLEAKQFHLRFLTHLIGDLHQPLHVGRSSDKGGNTIDVKFFGQEVNLHRLWDSTLIDAQNLSFTEFARFIDTQDKKIIDDYQSTPIIEWVKESHQLSKTVYDIGEGDFRYQYQFKHMPIVKERLLQAGIRLAGVLNEILDPESR
jgi:hypothetical protein